MPKGLYQGKSSQWVYSVVITTSGGAHSLSKK
jgi:hypothetical protein